MRLLSLTAALALVVACDFTIPDGSSHDAGYEDVPVPSIDEILRDNDCAFFTSDDFACGGDPTGWWEVVRSCPAATAWDPLDGTCPEIEADGDGDAIGEVVIRGDGTYDLSLDRLDVALSFTFPLSCYGGASEPCSGDNFSGVCEAFSDVCACDVDLSMEPVRESGTWFSYRSDLTFSDATGTTDLQFCRVDPHVMRMVRFAPEGGELSWGLVLRRVAGGGDSELGANPD